MLPIGDVCRFLAGEKEGIMATTRQLVTKILKNNKDIRGWYASHEGFTLDKAKAADLSQYREYVAAIIEEGLARGVVSRKELEGPR